MIAMKILITCHALFITASVIGQNVGIGNANPVTKLDVSGSLKVSAEYISSSTAPTAAQTYNMVNASTLSMANTDSVGRIYDPGGPAGNYNANLTANFRINTNSTAMSHLAVLIENINLGTGDSLILYDGDNSNTPVLYRVGNGFTGSAIPVSFSGNSGYCVFKSNGDASVGPGFSLLALRKFLKAATTEQPATTGNALVFYPQKAALRAGTVNAGTIGNYSVAIGNNTIATGSSSIAMGSRSTATAGLAVAIGDAADAPGIAAVSIGRSTTASGTASTAMGSSSTASGSNATAFGGSTLASGDYSTSMGRSTTASGDYSISMGRFTEASGEYSAAIGRYGKSTGYAALATGDSCIATGDYSTAMGYKTKASGIGAISLGQYTSASGDYSTAMGYSTRAAGIFSMAMGYFTISKTYGSLAIELANDTLSTENEFNVSPQDRVFIIGDGGTTLFDIVRSSSFYINRNGNAWMQGTLTQSSDARLKTNIHPVPNALGKIKLLTGYNYNWKDSTSMPGKHSGVLAQEVQQVMPELVTSNTEGQLAVNYNGMIPYLIESIKTLEKQNAALAKQNAALEKRMKKIERRKGK